MTNDEIRLRAAWRAAQLATLNHQFTAELIGMTREAGALTPDQVAVAEEAIVAGIMARDLLCLAARTIAPDQHERFDIAGYAEARGDAPAGGG